MRALRVGVVSDDISDKSDDVSDDVSESGPGGEREERRRPVVLSSDCYVPLVEAYAQSSMWERAIEAYQEGFSAGRGRVEAVDYRVSAREERRLRQFELVGLWCEILLRACALCGGWCVFLWKRDV